MECIDAGKAARRRAVACAIAGAVAFVPLIAPASGQAASAKAGPAVVDCKRLKGTAKRACRRRNAANKTVFLQLRDSQLIGARGDGESVDWTFCANGKTELTTSSGSGTGISRGDDWKVDNASVRNARSWTAEVSSSDGTSVGVLRRGGEWQVAVYSLDRFLYPGKVERSDAKGKCAGL